MCIYKHVYLQAVLIPLNFKLTFTNILYIAAIFAFHIYHQLNTPCLSNIFSLIYANNFWNCLHIFIYTQC